MIKYFPLPQNQMDDSSDTSFSDTSDTSETSSSSSDTSSSGTSETSSAKEYDESFMDEKRRRAELRDILIDQQRRRKASGEYNELDKLLESIIPGTGLSDDFPEYDYLLINSPSQSLYLMDQPCSDEFDANPDHIIDCTASDKEANGGLEKSTVNGAGDEATGHSQESGLHVSAEVVEDGVVVSELDKSKDRTEEAREAEIFKDEQVGSGLPTSKVNEACKAVEVLGNESSGADVGSWELEKITTSPSGKRQFMEEEEDQIRKKYKPNQSRPLMNYNSLQCTQDSIQNP